MALVDKLEAHDMITATHTWRVILYTRALAEDAGLDHDVVDLLSLGAALHDVGKLDVDAEILRKPARLTDDEFARVRAHTTKGEERLGALGITSPVVLQMVRSHHERIDGSGYPDGLARDAIPRPALYFGVVDSFDAMTSRRPYNTTLSEDAEQRALDELLAERGTLYCHDAVERFARLHERGSLDWIARHFNEDSPRFGVHAPGTGELDGWQRRRTPAQAPSAKIDSAPGVGICVTNAALVPSAKPSEYASRRFVESPSELLKQMSRTVRTSEPSPAALMSIASPAGTSSSSAPAAPSYTHKP